MKVVRIIARLNVGGPARHVVWLTAGLRGADFESLLVAGVVPPTEDDMGYFATANGVEPLVIPEMSREISPKDAVTVWKLYRLFRRERPDLVHTHTAKAGTVGRVAGLLYRWLTPAALVGRPRPCRFVHTYHGHIFHSYYGKLKTRVFLLIEKTLARLATDRIIVISPQQYREIHEDFGVGHEGQFAIIPLGLDTRVFANWSTRRHPMRAELGANDRDLLVGIVGRLTEIKNHELFLKAAARYKELYGLTQSHTKAQGLTKASARLQALAQPDGPAKLERRVRFVVIGDGHLGAALEAQARALGLQDDELIFAGTRNDPENFYPALDVVALTSRNEGTPLTLIEAMANARACIATAVGGVVDLLGAERAPSSIEAGAMTDDEGRGLANLQSGADKSGERGSYKLCERGVLVRPDDAEGFCAGLAHLIENENLRHELGARGRQFVVANYSKERLLADVAKLYRALTQEQVRKSKVQSPKSKVRNDSSTLDIGL